jgi:CAAX prenyl protease-like protein
MPSALAVASPAARNAWIALRVLAAVVTVPIAEELAFRGFLYRRLLSADFEAVSLRRFSWVALLVSSLIFGMLHGSRWFAGALAGALYAIALLRKGRICNAIVAHAVTNALIAADVLLFGHWQLW